jgi:hypothetical protein
VVGPVQVQHIPDGNVWGTRIVSEVNGDFHSQPHQHSCLHQQSVGPHQRSQQALRDFGATLCPIEKTLIEDQLAQILLWSSGGQLFGSTDNLKAMADAKPPNNAHKVRQFLILCNFFRGHVWNFA